MIRTPIICRVNCKYTVVQKLFLRSITVWFNFGGPQLESESKTLNSEVKSRLLLLCDIEITKGATYGSIQGLTDCLSCNIETQ